MTISAQLTECARATPPSSYLLRSFPGKVCPMLNDARARAPENETTSAPCEDCGRETRHKVITQATKRSDTDEMWAEEQWDILQCQGCCAITLRKDWTSSEDIDYSDGENLDLIHHYDFPLAVVDSTPAPIEGIELLPQIVRTIYDETRKAIPGLPILAGIGLRATIESVCNEKRIQGNLKEKIDKLKAANAISAEHAKLLHGSRLVGNEAAHELRAPNVKDLASVLEVVEHLLETVYILPKKNARLGKRAARSMKTTP